MMTLLMTIQNKKFFTEVLKTKADGEGGLGQSGELARSSEVVPGQRPGPTAHGVAPITAIISYPHLSSTDGRLYLHTSG